MPKTTIDCRRHGDGTKAYLVTPTVGRPWKRCAACSADATSRWKKANRVNPGAPPGGIYRGLRTTAGLKTSVRSVPVVDDLWEYMSSHHADHGATQSLFLNLVISAGLRSLDPSFKKIVQ